jgi:indole-3-glycerol phosphate synthase
MPSPLPPFNVGTLIPSMRDFLQAVRTQRRELALIPLLPEEDAAREALRMAEAGVAALALNEPGAAMAEAANATRVPLLCLRLVSTKDDYLAARAFGADAVLLDPSLNNAAVEDLAKGARSTRMVALPIVRDDASVQLALRSGAKALVLQGDNSRQVTRLASLPPAGVALIGWPGSVSEDEARLLRGVVDASIVGVDIYGMTGFERFVSEMSPG